MIFENIKLIDQTFSTDDDYAPSTSLHMPLYRRGVVMELKDVSLRLYIKDILFSHAERFRRGPQQFIYQCQTSTNIWTLG